MVEFKHGPNINYGPPTDGEGPPIEDVVDTDRKDKEREMGERAGIYPMEGSDIIELLTEVEIGEKGNIKELELATKEALAYKEGLKFGFNEGAYFDGEEDKLSSIIYLQNMFTSVEGATDRPRSSYIEPALEEAIGRRVRESMRYESSPEGWKIKQERKFGKINRTLIARKEKPWKEEEIAFQIEPQKIQLERSKEARPALRRLENHIEARKIIDAAFIQRMNTCEDPQGSTEIAKRYGIAVSPDKGHWKTFFQEGEDKELEWGKKVNDVFWRIVAFGLPDNIIKDTDFKEILSGARKDVKRDIYSTGFEQTKQFASWMKYLLEGADGDMDAVWAAWRVALLWEVPNELGLNIETGEDKHGKKFKKKWRIPFPPIGSALHSFSAHVEAKRALEFGLKPDGLLDKTRADRFVSHSGLPMSLGKFPSLCRSFLHESECKFSSKEIIKRKEQMAKLINNLPKDVSDPYYSNMHEADIKHYVSRYEDMKKKIGDIFAKAKTKDGRDELMEKDIEVDISLWELGLFAGIGFNSKDFPWMKIEESLEGEEAGEIAPGGFGSWLLKRSRAWSIIKDIRSRPSLSDIANPDYFNDENRTRNWSKVLGPLIIDSSKSGYVSPVDNPRAWWVAGIIWYHIAGTGTSCPITKIEQFRDHRTVSRAEEIKQKRESAEARGPVLGDIFRHAINSGFLRKADIEWIMDKKNLDIKLY
jgi:hypothetical protein